MVKKISVILSCIAAVGFSSSSLHAKNYPSKPIILIAPKAAGGAADLAARVFAAVAEKHIGQKIRVVNKPGGGGVPGMMSVRASKADGYTLMATLSPFMVSAPIFKKKSPYKTFDFTYLSILEQQPLTYAVRKDSPYKDMKSLIAALKSANKPIRIAVAAKIALATLSVKALALDLGLSRGKIQMIPFKGGPKAARGLLAGDVDMASINLASINASLKSGDARLLMVTTPKPNETYSDAPTAKSLGLKTVNGIVLWAGLVGPKGLPSEVIEKWSKVLPKVFADPLYKKLVTKRGGAIVGSLPAATTPYVKSQVDTFAALKKVLNKK